MNDRFDSTVTPSRDALNEDSPAPFDPMSIPEDIRKLIAEEEAEAAKPPDPEFEKRKHQVVAFRHAVHMRLGGVRPPGEALPARPGHPGDAAAERGGVLTRADIPPLPSGTPHVASGNLLGSETKGKKFTDQERADIARGWAASGLSQDLYAASYGVTSRALRGWMARFAPSQPSLERVEARLVGMLKWVQTELDGVRAERAALEFRMEGRSCISEPPSCTSTAGAVVFRSERRREPLGQPESPERPAEDGPTARPRRRSFFEDFRSD